ncbi:hypothetical protein SRHO_G00294200 [Serrasalmus rhombeus]
MRVVKPAFSSRESTSKSKSSDGCRSGSAVRFSVGLRSDKEKQPEGRREEGNPYSRCHGTAPCGPGHNRPVGRSRRWCGVCVQWSAAGHGEGEDADVPGALSRLPALLPVHLQAGGAEGALPGHQPRPSWPTSPRTPSSS